MTGKKLLSERIHSRSECGYTTDRDVAAAQIVAQRGVVATNSTIFNKEVLIKPITYPANR